MLDSLMSQREETTIILKQAVPVFIGYFTSWVDAEGRLQFREDVYGLDARLSREVFGN
jgi:murein L,D-transpeptidase YcbB/YkuD